MKNNLYISNFNKQLSFSEIKLRLLQTTAFYSILVFFYAFCVSLLPIDYYSFRPWEGLAPYSVLLGNLKFYPSLKLHTKEVGQLLRHTSRAVEHMTYWETDKFGFRNAYDFSGDAKVVIVGDSIVTGSGVSQHETISSRLADKLGVEVMQMAPYTIGEALKLNFFKQSPPKVVILQVSETKFGKDLLFKYENLKGGYLSPVTNWWNKSSSNTSKRVLIFVDRLLKCAMCNYFAGWVKHSVNNIAAGKETLPPDTIVSTVDPSYLFLDYRMPTKYSNKEMAMWAENLLDYQKILNSMGTELLIMVTPVPFTIYQEYLPPSIEKVNNINAMEAAMRNKNLRLVSVTESLFASKNKGVDVYIRDDGHFTASSLSLLSEKLAPIVRELLLKESVSN